MSAKPENPDFIGCGVLQWEGNLVKTTGAINQWSSSRRLANLLVVVTVQLLL